MATALQPGFAFAGDPGIKTLSHDEWAALFEAEGMPGETFANIVRGEAGYATNVQQRDPGDGMVGFGGIQATPNAWGSGSAASKELARLGGVSAMADPRKAVAMAKFLWIAAGRKTTPWYGQKFVTDQDAHYTGSVKAGDVAGGGSTTGAPATRGGDGTGGMFGPLIDGFTTALLWIGLLLGGTALVLVGAARIAGGASGATT